MFCQNCGKEIDDKAIVCPNCGVQQKSLLVEIQKPQPNGCGIAGFVLSIVSIWLGIFLIPQFIGIILSCIGVKNKIKCSGKGVTVAGLVINIITLCLYFIYWIVMLSLMI